MEIEYEIASPSDSIKKEIMVSSCTSDADSGCALDEYSWVPSGLTPQQIHDYMNSLPPHCIPYTNSQHRTAQLLHQLPPHDTHARYCHGLSDEEKRELKLFSLQRARNSLGRGTVCPIESAKLMENGCNECANCGELMQAGDLAVLASRAGNSRWHPACFACCVCSELLVDLIYFCGINGQIYCGRHHAETVKPRCVACDEIIFSEECTEAEGSSYHTKHFVCANCDTPLGGQRYVMHQSRPYCCLCYEQLFAACCSTCHLTIGVNEGHMVHGANRWHATSKCYRCVSCGLSLLGRAFVVAPSDEKIYCVECGVHDSNVIPDCDTFAAFDNKESPVTSNAREKSPGGFGKLTPSRDDRPDIVSDNVAFVDEEPVMMVMGSEGCPLDKQCIPNENVIDVDVPVDDDAILAMPGENLGKSKKVKNVRFDPSTKDACSPAQRGSYREYFQSANRRRGMEYSEPRDGCHQATCSFDGMPASGNHLQFSNAACRHGSMRRESNPARWKPTVGNADMAVGIGLGGDDCERCSTCSSSSSDSEFDYTAYLAAGSQRSQTLPSSSRRSAMQSASNAVPASLSRKKHMRRHKSKNCIVS